MIIKFQLAPNPLVLSIASDQSNYSSQFVSSNITSIVKKFLNIKWNILSWLITAIHTNIKPPSLGSDVKFPDLLGENSNLGKMDFSKGSLKAEGI